MEHCDPERERFGEEHLSIWLKKKKKKTEKKTERARETTTRRQRERGSNAANRERKY